SLNSLADSIKGKEYGMWVWVSPMQMTQTYLRTVVDAAAANKINTLYVTFDDYIKIAVLPGGDERNAKLKEYDTKVAQLVSTAREKGIWVDAEAGDKDWSNGEKYKDAFAIIDYVNAYNSRNPQNKIRGFQYDVEA